MEKTLAAMEQTREGLIYVNLVDFDSCTVIATMSRAMRERLEEVDAWVPRLLESAAEGDLVIFTADHGCDPTTPSTDHTREYVPLLVYGGRPVESGHADDACGYRADGGGDLRRSPEGRRELSFSDKLILVASGHWRPALRQRKM